MNNILNKNKPGIFIHLVLYYLLLSWCNVAHADNSPDDCIPENGASYTVCYADEEIELLHFNDSSNEESFIVMPMTNMVMYVPLPEIDLKNLFEVFTDAVDRTTGRFMETIISISPAENNTIIYYDHWEDGYENNTESPTQSSTEIWGDNNPWNGIPPGFTSDVINSGNVIALTNTIRLPRNPNFDYFDSRDKITSTKFIALSKSNYALIPGPILAGSVEVIDTSTYGTFYEIPIGEGTSSDEMFEHISILVMASENNTQLEFDLDGDGTIDNTTTINEGESYMVEGRTSSYNNPRIEAGATIASSKPVQAHMITGDLGGFYETRFFTLYPKALWDNCYYNPVGTTVADDPCHVFIYNPNTAPITMHNNTLTSSESFNIPAKSVYRYEMPFNSGAHFYTTNGNDIFFAIATIDSDDGENSSHDWGFTLLPEHYLTSSGIVGWGPGNSNLSGNGNPIWVTSIEPTIVYADFDNNPLTGPLIDPEGNRYDIAYPIVPYESIKIFDYNDNDQTGASIYTLNGTRLAIAWGQDPLTAEPGNPYLDLGTTVPPEQKNIGIKKAEITVDVNNNNLVDPGDEVTYYIYLSNLFVQTSQDVYLIDTIPDGLTYQANSTYHNGVLIPDNSPEPFPLIGPGYYIGDLQPYQRDTVIFTTIANNDILASSLVKNKFYSISNGTDTITASVTTPVNQIEITTCTLNFTNADGEPQSSYRENMEVCVSINDNDNNVNPTQTDTISVLVLNLIQNDWETIVLQETTVNSGIFLSCINASASAGQMPEDGLLYAVSGDVLKATHTDPLYADECTHGSAISILSEIKQLYFTDTLGLDRIDPVATGDLTTHVSQIPEGAGGSLTFTQLLPMCTDFDLLQNGDISANAYIDLAAGTLPANPDISATLLMNGTPIITMNTPTVVESEGGSSDFIIRDEFNSVAYDQNDGPRYWSTNWTEVDEDTDPAADLITITGNALQFSGSTITSLTSSPYILRQANLNGAISATLTFDISTSNNLESNDEFELQISDNGGFSWTTLQSYANDISSAESFDILPYASSNTTLRFGISNSVSNGEFFTIDNVQIAYTVSGNRPVELVWNDIMPLNITVPAGDTLSLNIVNNESGAIINILYDSNTRQSRINLPTSTVIAINDLAIYDAPYPDGSRILSSLPNDSVCIRTTVSDPFGIYDINQLGLEISTPAASQLNLVLTDPDTIFTTDCEKVYEYCLDLNNNIGTFNVLAIAQEGFEAVIADSTTTTFNSTFTDVGSACELIFTDAFGNQQTGFVPDEDICLEVTDADKNIASASLDSVVVTLRSFTGDFETMVLIETGISTGIFRGCIPSSSTIAGTIEDGQLYATPTTLLEAVYADPEYDFDLCITSGLIESSYPAISITKNLNFTNLNDSTAILDDVVRFDLIISNPGPKDIPGVALYDIFQPACLTYDSASIEPDLLTGGRLDWFEVGPVFSGDQFMLSVYFTASGVCEPTINYGYVEGTDTDGVLLSDGPKGAVVYISNPELSIVKTLNCPNGSTVRSNDILEYEIYIENTGTTTITELPLSDFSSEYCLEFIDAAPVSPDAVGGGTVFWSDLGPLAPGESLNLFVNFRALNSCNPAINVANVSFAIDENNDFVPAVQSEVLLEIQPLLDTMTSNNPEICLGEDAVITLNNSAVGEFYQLQSVADSSAVGEPLPGNGGDLNFTLSGLTDTSYYNIFSIDNATGCSAFVVDSSRVVVYDAPVVLTEDITICTQSTITIPGNPTGGSGNFTHNWVDLNTGSATGYTLSNENTATLTVDLNSGTTGTINLTYILTDDNNGCVVQDTALVTFGGIDGFLLDNVICNNESTNNNTSDDTFTFTLNVSGFGGNGWRGFGLTGTYGEDVLVGPFPVSGGDIPGLITNDFCNLELPVYITAPDACSTDAPCDIISIIKESFCCHACASGNIISYVSNNHNFDVPVVSNIALNKYTNISSRAFSQRSNPYFAIDDLTDGNSSTNPNQVITAHEENPWWEIDLGGNFNLTDINVFNRTDCCAATNYDFIILVSNNPFTDYNLGNSSSQPGVQVYTQNQTGTASFSIPVNNPGRFVRIYLDGNNQLQLAEVQVMGTSHANTNPYSYTWSDPSIGDLADPECLAPGTYNVTIQDIATGCEKIETIVIE